jgi:uncharacterized protein (TIGR02453 family)
MKRILDFLSDLGANNNREWFAADKGRYKEAEAIFNTFAEQLIALVGEWDASVRDLTLRDCTYRIYRDTRFSHDKTPYKTHFGLYICPGGKKSGNGGYYFHIEPRPGGGQGESDGAPGMIGNHLMDVGIYMPEPAVLKSVRDEIFDNGKAVLKAMDKAGKAGFELDRSNSLKRTPVGYPPATEWDDYLKLKDFHLTKPIDEAYILAPGLAERVAKDFSAAHDFMSLMLRSAQFAHNEGR